MAAIAEHAITTQPPSVINKTASNVIITISPTSKQSSSTSEKNRSLQPNTEMVLTGRSRSNEG